MSGDSTKCKKQDCESYTIDLFHHRMDELKYFKLFDVAKIEKKVISKVKPNTNEKNQQLCNSTIFGETIGRQAETCFQNIKIFHSHECERLISEPENSDKHLFSIANRMPCGKHHNNDFSFDAYKAKQICKEYGKLPKCMPDYCTSNYESDKKKIGLGEVDKQFKFMCKMTWHELMKQGGLANMMSSVVGGGGGGGWRSIVEDFQDEMGFDLGEDEIESQNKCMFDRKDAGLGDFKAVWKQIKPIIAGRILYTPSTPKVEKIINEANSLFVMAKGLKDFAKNWKNKVSKDFEESFNGTVDRPVLVCGKELLKIYKFQEMLDDQLKSVGLYQVGIDHKFLQNFIKIDDGKKRTKNISFDNENVNHWKIQRVRKLFRFYVHLPFQLTISLRQVHGVIHCIPCISCILFRSVHHVRSHNFFIS